MQFNQFQSIELSDFIKETTTCINNRCGLAIDSIIESIENADSFYLHTYEEISPLSPTYSTMCRMMRNTFAYSMVTQVGVNQFAHLVPINKILCDSWNLSIEEIAAVLIHELGHIFNNKKRKENENEIEIALLNELRADCFVNSMGFKNELISVLKKSLFIDQLNSLHEQFRLRINKLSEENQMYLDGEYKIARLSM